MSDPIIHPAPRPAPQDPEKPIAIWLKTLNSILSSSTAPSTSDISALFLPTSYWRDHLCLSWTYQTAPSPAAIESILSSQSIESITLSPTQKPPVLVVPVDFHGLVPAITAFVDVKTKHGNGVGLIRLLEDLDEGLGNWKAYTVFTALMGLDRFPEQSGANRPEGVTHGANPGRKNWKDLRALEQEFTESEPAVLIIGAGQGGLVAAARLKMLGIPTLVVDRNERVGDNWRKRYHQLVLHDPVYYDHMPYLPFPAHWPRFTPKDKLADWFEIYASALELNIWTSSTITASSWDPASKSWKVTITRPSGTRELNPRHIVIATGHSGEPRFPAISGTSEFQGDLLCHSSGFSGAKQDAKGKKAVVIGACNSGHDVAQDYYEKGYDVTMVQRSSTFVISSKYGVDMLMKGVYDEGGPPTEVADLLFHSLPYALLKTNHIPFTAEIAKKDKEVLDGLEAVGFLLEKGPHGAGLLPKYLENGGGYYIDVGASPLIASGGIKIKSGHGVAQVLPHGVQLDGGTKLDADEIVFATGYTSMVQSAAKILGEDAVEGVQDVWGVDKDTGEVRGMWKRAHPERSLWFMGGNLAITRWFSRGLALGIAGVEAGLV